LTKYVNSIVVHTDFRHQSYRRARSDRTQLIPFRIPTHTEVEYSVDVADCPAFVQAVEDWAVRSSIWLNFVFEIRGVAADEVWLSPNYHREGCHVTAGMGKVSEAEFAFFF
ncbi:unnamed protein product, partial [Symbiodinium sp. KB8]